MIGTGCQGQRFPFTSDGDWLSIPEKACNILSVKEYTNAFDLPARLSEDQMCVILHHTDIRDCRSLNPRSYKLKGTHTERGTHPKWCEHDVVQTKSGTNTKWYKHEVVQTKSGTNTMWYKQRVVQTKSGTNTMWYKRRVGKTQRGTKSEGHILNDGTNSQWNKTGFTAAQRHSREKKILLDSRIVSDLLKSWSSP